LTRTLIPYIFVFFRFSILFFDVPELDER